MKSALEQLINLWDGPEEDDYGRLRPTPDVFVKSIFFLLNVTPSCCASTDSEGGVRFEWILPTASVHLVIPKDLVAYIYHEIDNDYATEDATPERLNLLLHRLFSQGEDTCSDSTT